MYKMLKIKNIKINLFFIIFLKLLNNKNKVIMKNIVLGFEPIWFGPTILVRHRRVRSLYWPISLVYSLPISHQVNQRAQSLLETRFATAINQSINTFRSKRSTHTWVAHTFVHHFFISHYLHQVISSTILPMLIL
jgi:hypothetical protein